MKITLDEGPLREYARTDDAVKAFNVAVANGQSRLAMEMLVPIINAITADSNSESEQEIGEAPKVEAQRVKKASKAAAPKVREEEDQNLEK